MCAHTVNSLPFHKMHGLGNDFIMLDLREGFGMPSPQQLRMLADRRLGIGCDQIMVLSDTQNAGDIHLDMFNADGSVAGACGNGTRCVAWFEMQKNGKDALEIETISGMLYAHKTSDDMITVNMGKPRFSWAEIPLVAEMDAQRLAFETMPFGSAFCVNMGNPHAVFIVPDAEEVEVEKWGAFYETHPHFPDRANIEFISPLADNTLRMRVFERGAGITRACGSGACAAGVAAISSGQLSGFDFSDKVEIILDGGSLIIEWAGNSDAHDVWMIGSATYVSAGQFNLELLASQN